MYFGTVIWLLPHAGQWILTIGKVVKTSQPQVTIDPLFINPSTGDYHLLFGSPAIDTGTNTSGSTYGLVVDDIIGTLRPQDGVSGNTGDMSDYDMGAYEMPAM